MQTGNKTVDAVSKLNIKPVEYAWYGAHAQAAHRIANTEPNRRKWGAWIIDSPLNVGYTLTAPVKVMSTALTPALKIRQAMQLAQEGYEEELAQFTGKSETTVQRWVKKANCKMQLCNNKMQFEV